MIYEISQNEKSGFAIYRWSQHGFHVIYAVALQQSAESRYGACE
ncbi:MAG: hypothetical protein K0R64_2437 [Novosphingobium lindaniclasticum]|jgi:hypothetical protein|nr:hypothetical protein [Novosphingobium lindaniclasticum]